MTSWWTNILLITGLCLFTQGFAVKDTYGHASRSVSLEKFIRLLTDTTVGKSEEVKNSLKHVDDTDISRNISPPKKGPNNNQNNFGIQRSVLEQKIKGDYNNLVRLNRPKMFRDISDTEENNNNHKLSPVALNLLKRLMFGTSRQRAERADTIIGIGSRDNSLPWETDCSGGYDHCGGYFPLCCEGFVCLKPLTPWDKAHGFNRCWPHYFQDESEENQP